MKIFMITFLMTMTAFTFANPNVTDNFWGITKFSDAELSELFGTGKQPTNDREKYVQCLRRNQ